MRDYEIEQLEAELEKSRFGKWDVETLLADRHRKKIEALTNPKSDFGPAWQAIKDLVQYVLAYIGAATLAVLWGHWMLTGSFLPS